MQLRRSAPSSKKVDFQDYPNFIEQNEAEQQPIQKKNDKQFSLTLLTPVRGEIPLPTRQPIKQKVVEQKGLFHNFKKKDQKQSEQQVKEERDKTSLPCPKFSKLGQMIYCVYNANIVSVYQYVKDARGKKKRLFEEEGVFTMDSQIKFVRGNKKLMLVAFQNQFVIIPLEGPNAFRKQIRKATNSIIGGCFEPEGEFVIITNTSVTKYFLNHHNDIVVMSSYKINCNFGPVKFIEVLKDQKLGKYLLIFAEKKKVTYNNESKALFSKDEPMESTKNGESLQIIELGFDSCQPDNLYQVSNIPEEGIFELSKAFYLGQESFLLSLYQQIIVVRKQFQKYIVVDNTAIASMSATDDSKTGQLVLVDKEKVVYNDHQGINVYNLLYVPREDKIQMQSVDNFAAIDQSQFKLYDGVLLESGDTNIQVLFYFDNRKIMKPGKKNVFLDNDEKEEEKYKLRFSVYAIVQSQPIERLIELLKLKRPQNQINQFRTHFNISSLEFYKSQWSVSQKSLNDIINNLLEISDEQFIESQLDAVLKKESTTLNFLIKIEEKQVTRLKKVIITKIDQIQEINSKIYTVESNGQSPKKLEEEKAQTEEQLIKIIKKLLQSKMFLKKLRFQNEFQAYKIIDFIEINKVREMSLKEQIKLLSSKGYQKRLKQFLNQFKYLAIANFQDIFKFLMENKDQKEAHQFLSKMGFMFPLAYNPDKQECDDFDDDPCILWEDFQSSHQISDKNLQGPETIDSFVTQLFPDENLKSKYLRNIMQEFIQTEWFKEGAFKKHCKLSIKYEQLAQQFNQLKTIKVYNILYKYLFQNIKDISVRQKIISSLLELGRLPQGFMVNMRIREQVYKLLIKLKLINSKQIKLPDFLILSETQYFVYLTVQNAPAHMFFEDIKGIYENVVRDSNLDDLRLQNVPFTILDSENDIGYYNKGFFEQCFEKSMANTSVQTQQLRFYLTQFITIGSKFQCQNQDLLQIILDAINRKFRIQGNIQQILGMADLLFRIDLLDTNPEMCSVFLEIAFFNGFWKNFSLDYTFYDINQQQSKGQINSNVIILQAIEKYCRNNYEQAEFEIIQLMNSSYDKLQYSKKKVNIRKPTDFFQFLLFMTNQIGYSQNLNIFNLQYFLLQMLKNQRFDQITELNVELFNFVKDKDPRQFLEQLILKHVKQMEENNFDIKGIYDHVVSSLNLVVPVTIRIKQQRAFLDLCKYAETLDYRILSKIPNIRQELEKSSLVFMMNIWRAGNIQEISCADPLKTRVLMQNIYEKYKETTSFDINYKAKASSDIEFLEFEIQRGYQYIERKLLGAALQICRLLSNQDKLYFSDLVYSLTCEVGKTLQSTNQQNAYNQYIKLIEFSIAHDSIPQVINHLDQIMQSQQSVQFRLVNALSIISKMVKIYIADRDIGNKDKIYYELFFNLLSYKPIEAFYFLMKNKNLNVVKTIDQLKENKQIKISKEEISKHLALAIYIRSLDKVVKDFYATYSFFQQKQKELSTDRVKRDINILASKLKLIKIEQSEQVSDYLMYYYNLYMESLSLSGFVDLTKIKETTELDIDKEMGHISKEYLRQKQQIEESKRKYQELMKNINSKPKPIPIPTSQQVYRHQEPESPIQLPSRKFEKYQEIKRRELADLKKVEKQFVRQQTTSNVDKILQMFKEKKQQRLNNLRQQGNAMRQRAEEIKSKPIETHSRAQPYQRTQLYTHQKANDPAFQIRQRVFERPMKQRIEEELRKRNVMQKPEKPYTEHFISRNQSQKLDESIVSNMSEFRQQMPINVNKAYKQQSIQYSLDELKKYLLSHNQAQVLKYFQKFELVYENQTLGKQFIKKMFQNSLTFNTWTKVIEVIIKNYQIYSKLFEVKSLKLCSQLLKIDTKIDPKLLFDLSFFSFVVPNVNQQKYYSAVFDHLKTNIVKLIDDNNVHSLAKAFFYGMGLMKKYENMIYIYYLDARLEQYLNIPFNSKQQQMLVQKLKSSYSKLGYDVRDNCIRDLFRNKLNTKGSQKIRVLVKILEQSIDRSSKIKNIAVSKDDESLLKLLKSL